MAAQAAMISDTIVGLKRALLRQEKGVSYLCPLPVAWVLFGV